MKLDTRIATGGSVATLKRMNTPLPTAPRIVLAGGSGFLGQSLADALLPQGWQVVVLTRGVTETRRGVQYVQWDARTPGEWVRWLDGAQAVINLVGRTVDCRKTPQNKRVILESRVDSVRALAEGWKCVANPPKVWVQFATAHIWGDTHDEVLDDNSPIGTGFAPDVGMAWERALNEADLPGVRKVILRISFVLGQRGGPLPKLARIARLMLGGTIGSGRQYMSWIHVDDLNAIILRALTDDTVRGVYATTAPNPVTNAEFMRLLRRAVHRPWSPPVLKPMVHVGAWFMRTDPELALLGRRIVPTRLLSEGFSFRFQTLESAFDDLLK
jgi:uncharacterized protein (TIGR01777 family)